MHKNEFEILFEDDEILAINKPAGMLTIPDRYDKNAPNLVAILKERYEDIFTVHRLDKETSGVLLFAKSASAHRDLSLQFQEQRVLKIYHAVVGGIVPRDEIEIDIPLILNPANKPGVLPSARGKESLTILKVLERFKTTTLVECNLVTGRHHQLRAHVASIGHPLLIDDLYGENTEFFLSSIKKRFNLKKNDEEKPVINRITMHAYRIAFAHPETHEQMSLVADYPKDFRVLLQVLKKYSSIRTNF